MITLRAGTDADWPELTRLDEICFGRRSIPADTARWQSLMDPTSVVVATDDGTIVGKTMAIRQTITVPGGAQVAAAGVTSVGVAPTHRRRGVLRAMYDEQHRAFAADALPLAILTASEGGIYRRFGYGPATEACKIHVDRRFAALHAEVSHDDRVRMPPLDDAIAPIRDVYDRWQAQVPGAQVRPQAYWDLIFAERNAPGDGRPFLYSFVHPDGFVLYTRKADGDLDAVRVHELRAVTDAAYAALWRTLLGLDLVANVESVVAPDDPLPYLLTDARQVVTDEREDALWVRIMDVPAALTARTYGTDLDLVLDVRDPFLDAGGRFRLRVREGTATCSPTSENADIALSLDSLGSLYLGTHRAVALARAMRIAAKDPELLRRFDSAFATDRPAEMGWGF